MFVEPHPEHCLHSLFIVGGPAVMILGDILRRKANLLQGVYKAVCALNPVLNMDTMHHLTDMTEW